MTQSETRSIKLLECCDDTSSAAFNRILLSSAMEVDWYVQGRAGPDERARHTEHRASEII